MANKIILENGTSHTLTRTELYLLVQSVHQMSEERLTSEQKTALQQLRELFENLDF